MEFTLVFERSQSHRGGNYNLVFEPCPLWDENGVWWLNLNPETPEYKKGSLKRLIEGKGLQENKKCLLVVHNYGYGDTSVLETLESELKEEGINYKVVNFDAK